MYRARTRLFAVRRSERASWTASSAACSAVMLWLTPLASPARAPVVGAQRPLDHGLQGLDPVGRRLCLRLGVGRRLGPCRGDRQSGEQHDTGHQHGQSARAGHLSYVGARGPRLDRATRCVGSPGDRRLFAARAAVTGWEALAVALAGLAAGTINTVVGSGTLITFPVLLAVGYPPVLANVSNTVGLVPGSVSGADRLPRRAGRAGPAAGAARQRIRRRRGHRGGGAAARARTRVPGRRPGADRAGLRARRGPAAAVRLAGPAAARARVPHGGPLLYAGVLRRRGLRGLLRRRPGRAAHRPAGPAAGRATCSGSTRPRTCSPGWSTWWPPSMFIAVHDVAWEAAGLIAVGSVVGGQVGAKIGRRVPAAGAARAGGAGRRGRDRADRGELRAAADGHRTPGHGRRRPGAAPTTSG